MSPKIKNIILFVGIGLVLAVVYFVFIKKAPEEPNLQTVSSGLTTTTTNEVSSEPKQDSQIAKDFLALLLSVKGINLDDSIFANTAFSHLRDSSILLVQDGNEGRANPFAPIGTDVVSTPVTTTDLNASVFDAGIAASEEPEIKAPAPKTTTPKTNSSAGSFSPSSLNEVVPPSNSSCTR